MKRTLTKILALCLCLCLLLTGCVDLGGYFRELGVLLGVTNTAFADMEYIRPRQNALQEASDAVDAAIEGGADAEQLMECVYAVYEQYYDFYTNYSLANIHYYKDLTDIYWEDEFEYCLSLTAGVDAVLDQMLYTLADCPLKEELESNDFFGEDFFDAYQGESIYDETFTAMMEQEAALQSRYYELSEEAMAVEYGSEAFHTTYGSQMLQLYVDLVALRQEIATYAGYPDYASFAYEFYYYRDYTPEQAAGYLADISRELVGIYQTLGGSPIWKTGSQLSTEQDTFCYVQQTAEALGGTTADAFEAMRDGGLYDISYSENKYAASFEVYLTTYSTPFVFVNPGGTVYDQLTFVHEFGHFCNDFASFGSGAGIDVKEFFSQGMEYLSIGCVEGRQELETLKLADSLCIYVEQAAYAWFEHQIYALPAEELTAEKAAEVFGEAMQRFGMDMWGIEGRDLVGVHHFYDAPMYIVSYVVSNDAALQLYQLEKQASGKGKELYQANLATMEWSFLSFVEAAGLESPFDEGRIQSVRQTFETALK